MRWLMRRGRAASREHPVLRLNQFDYLTLDDVLAGIGILGSPGSGKTTAGLGQLAMGLLTHPDRPSLVIAPAKPSDQEQWRRWHARSGSPLPFVIFGPGRHCNWPQFELEAEGGSVDTLLPMFRALQKLVSDGQTAGGDAVFWEEATVRHTGMCFRGVWKAQGDVCLQDAHDFARGCPRSRGRLADADFPASYPGRVLGRLKAMGQTPEVAGTLAYFLDEWVDLADKTQSIIHLKTMQFLSPFLVGQVGQTMAGDKTDFTPRDLEPGMVLYIDFPVLRGYTPAKFGIASLLMSFNKYGLRRPPNMRPVVTLADEHPQTVLEGEDARIAATGRSSLLVQEHG